jgi:hypothetical protein
MYNKIAVDRQIAREKAKGGKTIHRLLRGRRETLQDRYDVYVQACKDLGIPAKSFDEWLAS